MHKKNCPSPLNTTVQRITAAAWGRQPVEHDRAECEAKLYALTEVNDLGWRKDQLAIIVLRYLDVTFVAAASPNTLYVLPYTTVKIFQSYMNLFLAIFF